MAGSTGDPPGDRPMTCLFQKIPYRYKGCFGTANRSHQGTLPPSQGPSSWPAFVGNSRPGFFLASAKKLALLG
jgi:hypothetical protein